MINIELSGIIKSEYDSWIKIKLIQENGYKIDLVSRFNEFYDSFPQEQISLKYYISDQPCSKEDILEGFLKSIYGVIDAEYQTNSYIYSEYTCSVDYDTILNIGGHNLFSELNENIDKFIIIELSYNN